MTPFVDTLPMLLNRALDGILPDYRKLFAAYDLTEQQWRVLRALWDKEPLTSAEISGLTLLPAPSLVGILDRLEKKGLISRIRSITDRRHVHVKPTIKGRALQLKVLPEVTAIQSHIQARLSADEQAELKRLLNKVAKPLTTSIPEAS